MDYSIIVPVFNREDLTRDCLTALLPTLDGAGRGEVIIVDNGSRPQTATVLTQFPWVRVLRNETNHGFAFACNQGARAAAGRNICFLNNDTVAQPAWLVNMLSRLGPGVGVVGARLLFPNDTIQHAGVAMYPVRFGPEGIRPQNLFTGLPRTTPAAAEPADFSIVTGACLLTPRDLFLELGGFDELFSNGYEDADYCLRVRNRGLRVVYEPGATLYHYEAQSGIARRRRSLHNIKTLGDRWGRETQPDHNRHLARANLIERESFVDGRQSTIAVRLPPITVIVHGKALSDSGTFVELLRDNQRTVENVVWLAGGHVPRGCVQPGAEQSPLQHVRTLLGGRSDRYFAFVDTNTALSGGWLDELANAIEYGSEIVAASLVSEDDSCLVEPCAADARCSLLNLRNLPVHVRFGEVDTIDGGIVDLTWQAVRLGLGVRAVRMPEVRLASPADDGAFAERYQLEPEQLRRPDVQRIEWACEDGTPQPAMVSIVMLSWNAPEYTKLAVESIRAYTGSPHEIIIVDNGSRPETLNTLRKLEGVRIIGNATNMGFAYGCNQGMAVATGTHVVLLNNDVVVTDGWLDNLLDAHRRDPLVGVSAPRSNRISGHQQINPLNYDSMEAMHRFAASRAHDFAGSHYRTNRAIGFCLCISRVVIDEVGGLDPRYGSGNFEDDDFCIRVQAAGYRIVVCEDVFIHHFGSASFAANNVDHNAQKEAGWKTFTARWGLPDSRPGESYESAEVIARGFVHARDYVPLPAIQWPAEEAPADTPLRTYATAFVALVDDEASWSRIGPIVTNYLRTLSDRDSAVFAIGVIGEPGAAAIGARIARSIERLKLDEQRVADIDVTDVALSDLNQWLTAIPAALRLRVAPDARLAELGLAADRSPSGLLRTIRGEKG
jgi:GT2 family glycosyltransferase